MRDDSPRILCHHLVGFFDVLGQSSKLRHLTKLPESDAERTQVVGALKNTVGVVLGVRGMFKDFFETSSEPSAFARGLPRDDRRILEDVTRAKVTYRGISDSFIVTVCLADTGSPTTPINGVYRTFVAAAGMWLLALSIGHPLRGGIDVGLGINIDGEEIYGPVLDCAYRLESNVAGGPRIAVGSGCLSYLRFVQSRPTITHERVASAVASWCLSMIRADNDGVPILDPLGERMRELASTGARTTGNLADRVAPAHDVVRSQLADARRVGDAKLVSRYEGLLTYFDERAGDWS